MFILLVCPDADELLCIQEHQGKDEWVGGLFECSSTYDEEMNATDVRCNVNRNVELKLNEAEVCLSTVQLMMKNRTTQSFSATEVCFSEW